LLNYGWCQFKQQKYNRAIKSLEKSYKLTRRKQYIDISDQLIQSLVSFYAISDKSDRGTKFILKYEKEPFESLLRMIKKLAKKGEYKKAVSGIVEEDLFKLLSSANYFTESVFFTYSNQEDLEKDIYLLKTNDSNAGTITIQVKDQLSNFIEGAVVNALEWRSDLSSFISVAECTTNVGGSCSLNIELNIKSYKFSANKGGVSKTTNSQIITTTGTTQTIILEDIILIETPVLENLISNFSESISNNISTTRSLTE